MKCYFETVTYDQYNLTLADIHCYSKFRVQLLSYLKYFAIYCILWVQYFPLNFFYAKDVSVLNRNNNTVSNPMEIGCF